MRQLNYHGFKAGQLKKIWGGFEMAEEQEEIKKAEEESASGENSGQNIGEMAKSDGADSSEEESGSDSAESAESTENTDKADSPENMGEPPADENAVENGNAGDPAAYAEKKNRKSVKWLFPVISAVLAAALIAVCVRFDGAARELASVQSEKAKTEQDSAATAKELKQEKADNASLRSQIADLTTQNDSLASQNEELSSKNDELENGASAQLVKIKNAHEAGNWQETIDLYNTLHQKYNGSSEDTEAKALADDAQAQLDAEKQQAEAEAAKGYETGITYQQLARTPDQYEGQKVKFTGKVVQVIEGTGTVQIRLAVNDDYDSVLLGQYDSSIVSSRVLEDDHITIYGTSLGTVSYESVLGGTITIPAVYIEKIDQ